MRRRVALAGAGLVLLSGCSFGGSVVPGVIAGPDTYPVKVVLADAGNLVPKQTCRANNVVVGSVESVRLDRDLHAVVVCRVKKSVHLPANVSARLAQTSLLGERFVALDPPADAAPRGRLAPGSTLAVDSTSSDPDTETVLGALSQVLNGGSLGSAQQVLREINTALESSDPRHTLRSLDVTVASLNQNRDAIVHALTQVRRLSVALARQRDVIGQALDTVPSGLAVLDRERDRFVNALGAVERLSDEAGPVIEELRGDTVTNLRQLGPVLAELSEAGDDLALTLQRVITFPFPSTALAAIKGDYGGLYGTLDLDLDLLDDQLAGRDTSDSRPLPGATRGSGTTGRPQGRSTPAPTDLVGTGSGTLTSLIDQILGGGRS